MCKIFYSITLIRLWEREVKLLHLLRKCDLENCQLLSKPTLQCFCHNWIDKFPACGFVCRDLKAWQSVTGAPSLIWFREVSSACQRETNESWRFILSVTDRWSHGLPPWSLLEGGEGWILVDTDTTNRPLLNPKGFIFQPAEYELQHDTLKLQTQRSIRFQ